MGKTFGLFACASVVAASVWWASSQQTGQAVLAQIDPGSGIGGPPGFGGPPSEGDAQLQAAQRARISDMMRRAAQMEQRGNLNAAIRFAASADALVRSSGIPLNPQAESPAEFIARLQGKSAPQNGGEPQTGNPFAAASQPSRPAPTVPGTDSPAKQQAKELLRQGRQAFQSGDLLSARELALEAQRIQATWTLFEDNPTQLLDDIERKTNTTTFAAAPFPSESPDAQNMANNPFADPREAANGSSPVESLPQPAESTQPAGNPFAVTGQAPAAPQPNQNDLNKAEAQKLMAAARKDAEAGRFDEAREKLKKAESLKVIYNISDERPALVLRDIARMESEAGQLAQITPGVSSQPSAGDEAKREQAQKLLEEARAAIRSGQFDAAEKKIEQARTLNAPYQQFDDTPELVAELLKRFRPSDPQDVPVFPGFPPVATTSEPVASNEPPAPKSFPPVPQRPAPKAPVIEPQAVPEPERIEAPKVADNAPAEPEVNPFAAAPQTEAPQTEAPLAEAPQVEPVAPPQPIPSQPTSPKPPQPEAQGAFDIANKAPAPPETEPSTIHPDGVVAAELYDRGLKHYYDGRYEEAYDAFLNCYRTGQKMDPYRAQSLQDMLQTLRPIIAQRQAAGDIQQTSGQRRVGPGTGNDFGGIDQAEREQNVKYEKLRSEALNNIFKAERLKEKSPTEALELIDRTMTIVSDADLTEQQLAPLVRQLKMARGEIEAWQKQRAPLLELEERNAKVKDIIVQQRRTEIRIEQELADLVEEYNTLFRQRRYAEAEVIAKEAKELDPENPVTETMFWKARFARRDARNEELKIAKEEGFIRQLDSVEWSAIPIDDTRPFEFPDPKTWEELTKRRSKYGTDNRIRTDKEIQIEKSLIRPISLHFTETPLNEVIKHIAAAAGINVVVDNLGLSEEGILPDQPVTINVDEIRLSSALNLMLEPLHLSYMIQDEVLKITSKVREQGEMKVVTYPVADLVIPIPNFKPSGGTGLVSSGPGHNAYSGPANFSVPAGGSLNPVAQYQVGDNFGGLPPINDPWAGPGLRSDLNGGGSNVDFDTLSDLIISTIEPESWAEAGGGGQVKSYETTLSLVIRQTQQVHEEIRDLLEQLRRLQDLQVTIEVRFVTVADRFFERIGIDFDFNVQDNVEADTVGLTPPPFGTPLGVLGLQGQQNQQGQQAQQGQQGQGAQTGVGGIGGGPGARNMLIMGVPGQVQGQQQGGQQQGQQAQQGQVAQAGGVGGQFLQPGANMNLPALDDWPKNGTIVGLSQPGQFTPDLDIGFQQGSFDLGVPDFGNFQPSAGIEVGMAILTDIEAFFFINAAQADERSNIMFAPKVTMFNGQQATVQSTTQRPFVTSLVPTVGFAAVGFTPQITVLSEGVTMQVLAVISADRRFVRLTVVPNFTNITDVFTFTFSGGGGGGQAGGQANTGVAGQGGFNPIGGQGGGIAGGQVGGQIGVGGIGGGPVAPNALALGLPSQMGGQFGVGGIGGVGGGIGGIGGVGGGQVGAQVGGVGGGAAVGATTIQQPVFEVVNVTTTVSVPDGGTVLLGGIKRLREGRNMAGVPILNKIPYISRLFKNTGVGRETESLMLMVTPRIIIQEEEEELLGIPL